MASFIVYIRVSECQFWIVFFVCQVCLVKQINIIIIIIMF